MNQKEIAHALEKVARFNKRGSFFLGTCNDSVIAGYGIDAPSSALYIWKFVIPTYDNVEFLHFSLGKRIVTIPRDDKTPLGLVELFNIFQRDWSSFSEVTDCESLTKYIELEKLEGTYARWVRYLTHIRSNEFDFAERLHDDTVVSKEFRECQAVSKSFAAMAEARSLGGWKRCSALLDDWQAKTKAICR